MQVSGQLHALIALPPGKDSPVPIAYEADWVPEPVCTIRRSEKSLALAVKRTPTVQLVIRCSADWAATNYNLKQRVQEILWLELFIGLLNVISSLGILPQLTQEIFRL
jgi:hypothetical protein